MSTNVTITPSNLTSISQAMRAALSGANACAKLGYLDQRNAFLELLTWAENEHSTIIYQATDNPNQG